MTIYIYEINPEVPISSFHRFLLLLIATSHQVTGNCTLTERINIYSNGIFFLTVEQKSVYSDICSVYTLYKERFHAILE